MGAAGEPPFMSNFHTCKYCMYRTKSAFLINHHLRMCRLAHSTKHFNCSQSAPEAYRCDECDFETHLMFSLNEHNQVFHSKIKNEAETDLSTSYKCESCSFETFSQLVLMKHLVCRRKCKRKKSVEWFSCNQCSYKTTKNFLLSSHATTHLREMKVKWYKCKKCPFKTKWKCDLITHLNKKHSDIYFLECEHCSFTASRQNELERHVHTKHKPLKRCRWIDWFECSLCAFKTSKMKKLEQHNVVRHTAPEDIKWIQCDYCSYRGKLEQYVKAHMRSHHQYTHTYCDAPFRFEF